MTTGKISGLIITALAVISCVTTQNTFDAKDLSYLYNPTKNSINPLYTVTNQSEDNSVLSIKLFASELFFSEANPRGIPLADMAVTVKLFDISQGRVLADTAHIDLSIEKQAGKDFYIYSIPLTVKKGLDYIAEVKILDRLRALLIQSFVPFNTLSETNSYNFEAHDYIQKNLIFNHVLKTNNYVSLNYLRKKPDSLYISYYKPFSQIPDPPSMLLPEKTIDYGPDTIVAFALFRYSSNDVSEGKVFLCALSEEIQLKDTRFLTLVRHSLK